MYCISEHNLFGFFRGSVRHVFSSPHTKRPKHSATCNLIWPQEFNHKFSHDSVALVGAWQRLALLCLCGQFLATEHNLFTIFCPKIVTELVAPDGAAAEFPRNGEQPFWQ